MVLNGKVQYSAQDFVIWMQSLEEMTDLVAKLVDAADKIDANFAAIVGTPVPAVIGTDYQALKRMCEKRPTFRFLPLIPTEWSFTIKGKKKRIFALFTAFAKEKYEGMQKKSRYPWNDATGCKRSESSR